MVKEGSGKILFTTSIASLMPAPFESIYAGTKAERNAQPIRNYQKPDPGASWARNFGNLGVGILDERAFEFHTINLAKVDRSASVAADIFLIRSNP